MTNASADRYLWPRPKGSVLFEEGDPGDRLFVIQSGRVDVLVRGGGGAEVLLARLGPGECVGELSVLDGRPRSATAVVAEDATLVALERDTFEQMVRENAEVAVRLLRQLAGRLREADRIIHERAGLCGPPRALRALRSLALEKLPSGRRALPAGMGVEAVAARAGLTPSEARADWERLRLGGLLDDAHSPATLAPDEDLDAYETYLALKGRYDPWGAPALAELTGLSAEEVSRISRRVVSSQLWRSEAPDGLVDSYPRYLRLKRRFELLDRADSSP